MQIQRSTKFLLPIILVVLAVTAAIWAAQSFLMPGTQPETLKGEEMIESVDVCFRCHSRVEGTQEVPPFLPYKEIAPFFSWQGTMMANSARDPVF